MTSSARPLATTKGQPMNIKTGMNAAEYIDAAAAEGRLYHFNGAIAWVRVSETDDSMAVIQINAGAANADCVVVSSAREYIENNRGASSYYKASFTNSPLMKFYGDSAPAITTITYKASLAN